MCELSRRYIMLYELITGNRLELNAGDANDATVAAALKTYFSA